MEKWPAAFWRVLCRCLAPEKNPTNVPRGTFRFPDWDFNGKSNLETCIYLSLRREPTPLPLLFSHQRTWSIGEECSTWNTLLKWRLKTWAIGLNSVAV